MAEELDVEAMIQRFRDRAAAVRQRNLPPVAGPERTKFVQQAQADFQDFAMIGDAEGSLEGASSRCGSTFVLPTPVLVDQRRLGDGQLRHSAGAGDRIGR